MFLLKEELALYEAAMKKAPVPILPVDDLRGVPVIGSEGKYWWTRDDDLTEVGLVKNIFGIKSPRTLHQPTGCKEWYRKVWKKLNGIDKVAVWELHQKDLSETHEDYGDSE